MKQELPLKEDSAIERLVCDFESLSLSSDNWTHRAHLAVAVHYLRNRGFDQALRRMRERINAYNVACGNPNGYNETITILFLRKIAAESNRDHPAASMSEAVARLEHLCPVDWLDQHYSRERIESPHARQAWVEPDLRELDF